MNTSQSVFPMNDQHRATARQWAWIKSLADRLPGHFTYSTIQELHDRIEALEATQHAHVDASHVIDPEREEAALEMMQAAGFDPKWSEFARCAASIKASKSAATAQPNYPAKPDSSLVERVAKAIHPNDCADPNLYLHEARAAIREVATWLRENDSKCEMGGDAAATADLLEQEAKR